MIIIPYVGQSNNGAAKNPYPVTHQYLRFSQDGRWYYGRDAGGLVIAAQENGDRSRYGWNQAATGVGQRYGWDGGCHDQLIARGVTERVVFAPHWKGGTPSADWAASAATSPDVDLASDALPIFRHRMRYLLSATEAKIGAIPIYQGESNAYGVVGSGPADYATHWGIFCDDVITKFGTRFLHPTLRFLFIQLFETNPDPGFYVDWDAVRAAQVAFVASRSDCIMVTAPDGPFNSGFQENVHLDAGTTADNGTRGLGKIIANALVDEFGVA